MRLVIALLLGLGMAAQSASSAAAVEPLPPAVAEIRSQLSKNDLDAAIDAAEHAADASPNDARTWFWSGRAYGLQAMRANLLTKAKWAGRSRDAYEKAVAMDPTLTEARYDLMQYYLFAPGMLGGGRDKAEVQAAELARQDFVWGKLATSAMASMDKKPEAAEAALREAVDGAPESARARLALSGMLQRQERWDEMWKLWNDGLTVDAARALSRYQLGRTAAVSGKRLNEGLEQIDAFISAGELPENLTMGVAHWRRGLLLEKLGRRDEAIVALTLATQDPEARSSAQPDLERIRKSS